MPMTNTAVDHESALMIYRYVFCFDPVFEFVAPGFLIIRSFMSGVSLEMCSIFWLILPAVFLGYLLFRFFLERKKITRLDDKAVLITGCDTGFGRALALKCTKAGFTVFAGCLTDEGVSSLSVEAGSESSLISVKLDVTKDDSVAAARLFIDERRGGKKLWAVVNNAGIFSCYGPADWCTIAEYQLSFDVNTLGGIRVANAFIDLLKESRGRIVSVSSVAGRMATAGTAPYSVAKYGVEAWMDCLRRELGPFGITVCLLEPGICKATNLMDSGAMEKRAENVWTKLSEEKRKEYGEEYKATLLANWNGTIEQIGGSSIAPVVEAYFHALTAEHPRMRYQCGYDAILLWIPMSYLPTPIQDAIIKLLIGNKIPVPASCQNGGKHCPKARKE